MRIQPRKRTATRSNTQAMHVLDTATRTLDSRRSTSCAMPSAASRRLSQRHARHYTSTVGAMATAQIRPRRRSLQQTTVAGVRRPSASYSPGECGRQLSKRPVSAHRDRRLRLVLRTRLRVELGRMRRVLRFRMRSLRRVPNFSICTRRPPGTRAWGLQGQGVERATDMEGTSPTRRQRQGTRVVVDALELR